MRILVLVLSLALSLSCIAAWAAPSAPHPHPAKATLRAFDNEAEFQALLERWRDAARQRQQEGRRRSELAGGLTGGLALQAAPSAAAPGESSAKAAGDSASSAGTHESITNVQTVGVDEGGIVKRAGDHLVILRRGRLFTVHIGNGTGADDLRPVAAVDAYAPGSNPQGAWYDELLIHGRTIVVVGFSYARGGTEIGLFELGDDGSIAYRATHHLRSHDYYSSRNYASRLVGNRLVFYAPMRINPWQLDAAHFMPQWRRWQPPQPGPYGHQASPQDWTRILPATRIFRTDDEVDPFTGGATLHTVTACELRARAEMHCEAQAVLGPAGRVFYVSADNVFVWTTAHARRGPWGIGDNTTAMPRSSVVRMPLDGTAPSALKTTGSPIDQLSFLQDASGHLNVLLRSHARGDGMWGAEHGRGDFALLRVPLASFGNGRDAAPNSAYGPITAGIQGHAVHNRYVGDWLLVGAVGTPRVHALRYGDTPGFAKDGNVFDVSTIDLQHGVERIEALGHHALVAGNAGRDLHFSTLRLDARSATLASHEVRSDAAQGESRTHGFFYRATSHDDGILGLPIITNTQGGRHGEMHGQPGPQGHGASVVFLRNRGLELSTIGKLDAQGGTRGPRAAADDGCKASCVDWYGNARPIFLGERVFALMGYELVEGQLRGGMFRAERIDERRRVDFSPRSQLRWGREG